MSLLPGYILHSTLTQCKLLTMIFLIILIRIKQYYIGKSVTIKLICVFMAVDIWDMTFESFPAQPNLATILYNAREQLADCDYTIYGSKQTIIPYMVVNRQLYHIW